MWEAVFLRGVDMDKIELLKQYKELLDSGILTQEEFDAKKRELLKINSNSVDSNTHNSR